MQPAEPSIINLIQSNRPPCSKCGTLTQLARIEPAEEGHDLRTFECAACGATDAVKVKFR